MYWVAGVLAVVLVAFSNRYGYHRDELYFLAAGRHLSWGYADQPPLTPAVARAMSAIDADSLVLLRMPAVLAAVVVVICAGLMARELGGGRGAQALAAGAVASAAMVQGVGHMLSTAGFELAVWSVLTVLVLRLLREGATPGYLWPAIGAVVGIGLLNKFLLVAPVGVLAVSLAVVGPRKVFASKYFPVAVGVAGLLWLPYLVWQARNGWPQWELSRAIAGGSSGTSDSPVMFVLLQFGLMGPLLVPLWIYGLWWLWRGVRYRAFVVTYVVLLVVFLFAGGKAYYLGGMYPILLAAGAVGLARVLDGHRIRWAGVGAVVAVNAVGSALLFLPVFPVESLPETPVLAVNYDAGETVGWPEFVRQIGAVRAGLGPDVAVLTDNYGEAGAIERYGAPYDLPTPHSGHNSYWWWGPPPDTAELITVGIDRDRLESLCASIEPAGHLDNGLGIDNDEQGAPLFVCRGTRAPWSQLWPEVRRLG
ncbi:glycosyltransferase family 39 protein [Nocardia puris]|nr:glycosyltransferase family 39 protein [Nocardia puris]MBF6215104.1 glycosyltransferase family 39 protein [Nocardia puris]MBF6369615.1 glycosyltransferase family 39 protein [Nocardia puris]MBF6463190.1 glycosyltransferase family 39 protein [Nocardia puris]